MEFKFETAYSQEALTVMAKALRKTIRRKRSRPYNEVPHERDMVFIAEE